MRPMSSFAGFILFSFADLAVKKHLFFAPPVSALVAPHVRSPRRLSILSRSPLERPVPILRSTCATRHLLMSYATNRHLPDCSDYAKYIRNIKCGPLIGQQPRTRPLVLIISPECASASSIERCDRKCFPVKIFRLCKLRAQFEAQYRVTERARRCSDYAHYMRNQNWRIALGIEARNLRAQAVITSPPAMPHPHSQTNAIHRERQEPKSKG
jgi:hypothetical protein